jgi:hypothetical protein
MTIHPHDNRSGYFTLLASIAAAAISLALAFTLVTLGSNASQESFSVVQSQQAKAFANACGERALGTLATSASYIGTSTLAIASGTCMYNVSIVSGTLRAITAVGMSGTAIRRVEETLDLSTFLATSTLTLTSWQEVGD